MDRIDRVGLEGKTRRYIVSSLQESLDISRDDIRTSRRESRSY